MSNLVRAWKDEAYYQSLPVEEQAMLPTNPAGAIELTEAELETISRLHGGSDSGPVLDVDDNKDEAETQQIVTYQPIIATIVVFAPAAPECNNTASPASSNSIFAKLLN
jgi:mersacidin/lichenicidin family type 2 lantibiotic